MREIVTGRVAVKEANRQRIDDMLNKAQQRARARCVSAQEVFSMTAEIEMRLDIPKKYMTGIKATCNYHATRFPKAYGGDPEATEFKVVRTSQGWSLIEAYRAPCDDIRRVYLDLTEESKAAIIKKHEKF